MKDTYIVPPELLRVIGAAQLANTADQISDALAEIEAARSKKEHTYQGKGPKIRRKKELETQIMLAEATAFSSHVSADGKTGILPDGNHMPLGNEQSRKLFGKIHCKDLIDELGNVEAELAEMEVDSIDAQLDFEAAIKRAETLQSFAHVQARMLQYLASGHE